MTSMRTSARPRRTGRGLYRYQALGAVVATDLPVSDLPPAERAAPAAVTVRRATDPLPQPRERVREVVDDVGEPLIRVWDEREGLIYWARGVGRFWIHPSGREVRHRLVAGARRADVEHLLAGPVLGLALQLQGRVILHASAVVTGQGAVAFCGPHGIGKSTLAAAFTRAGYPMLTDDMLPLTWGPEGVRALHSLPRLKLWQDSLTALGEEPDRFGLVVSWLDKRRLTVGREWGRTWTEPVPLCAVYVLDPHPDRDRPVAFEAVAPIDAVFLLLANMYMAELLRGARAAHALTAAADLVATVPVRRVRYYRGFDELPRLCAAILKDANEGLG